MKFPSSLLSGMVIALAVHLAGCEQIEVGSVEPIIPRSEAIFDPELIGLWESDEAEGSVALFRESSGGDAYSFWAFDDKCAGSEVRLGRLGKHLAIESSCLDRIGDDLSLPHHRLLVLEKIGPDEIHTWKLDSEVLLEALQAGEVRLAYRARDDEVILYDSAANVREQLTTYLDRPGVLAEPWKWVRDRSGLGELLTRPGQFEVADFPCFEASPWPEADALFRRDPRWAGGDIASSVALGDGEVLWLLNNVRLSTFEGGEPSAVTNAVALQSGTDPSTAAIEFHLGAAPDGAPGALVSNAANERFHFVDGVRIGDRLLLLMERHEASPGPGWALVMVDNPDDEPASWRLSTLDPPPEAMEAVGMPVALLALGKHVYLLGSVATPFESYWVHVLRWPMHSVLSRDLARPEWMIDDAERFWAPGVPPADRMPLFESDTAEFTLVVDPGSGFFLAAQMSGIHPSDILLGGSRLLVESWEEPRLLCRAPGYGFGARLHPALTGADLVLTYNSSHGPRFLRLARCDTRIEP
jgi:hypothetical protein